MYRNLVRAFVIKGCWYLLENDFYQAKLAFFEAKNILNFTEQQDVKLERYLSLCNKYDIDRVKNATRFLIAALNFYANNFKSDIEDVKLLG